MGVPVDKISHLTYQRGTFIYMYESKRCITFLTTCFLELRIALFLTTYVVHGFEFSADLSKYGVTIDKIPRVD